MTATHNPSAAEYQEVVLTRVFAAPRALGAKVHEEIGQNQPIRARKAPAEHGADAREKLIE